MSIERRKTVVEVCPYCERENEFVWNLKTDGFSAYCPHCGKLMMICSECEFGDGSGSCNWTEEHGCRMCKKGGN